MAGEVVKGRNRPLCRHLTCPRPGVRQLLFLMNRPGRVRVWELTGPFCVEHADDWWRSSVGSDSRVQMLHVVPPERRTQVVNDLTPEEILRVVKADKRGELG